MLINMRKYCRFISTIVLLTLYLKHSLIHHNYNYYSSFSISGVDCQIIFDDDTDQKLPRQDTKQLSPVSSASTEAPTTDVPTSPANHHASSSGRNKPKPSTDTGLRCTTYDNKLGDCISIEVCDSLKNKGADILRKSTCGFQDDGLPQVCCAISMATTTIESDTTTTETVTIPPVDESPSSSTPVRPAPATVGSQSAEVSLDDKITTNNKNVTIVRGTRLRAPAKTKSGTERKFLKECGTPFSTTLRIVGGQAAADNAWPWFALLMIERRGTRNPECGATLIDDRHILTAAHCVVEQPANRALNKSRVIVRLGENDLKVDNDHYDAEVDEIIPHPMYHSATFKNDIALIKLTKKVNFTEEISPVCLPYDHEKLRSASMENQTAWVIGFGRLNYNGRSSTVLRQADLKIVSQSSCATAFSNVMKLTKEYVCAGATGETRKDSCQGDSGGPLLMLHPDAECCRWYIYGIVSFGYRCATPGYPGIYTRVNKYLDWIESKL